MLFYFPGECSRVARVEGQVWNSPPLSQKGQARLGDGLPETALPTAEPLPSRLVRLRS